jgi:rare lipoprotein A (peptidoglycan hydrolase)
MVSAAPIVHSDLASQLELAHVSVPHLNVFKKHDDEVAEYDEDNEDHEDDEDRKDRKHNHDEDEDEEEKTTTTTTATATPTKSSKSSKTTSAEEDEPTTTSTKSSKSSKTTTTEEDEPTATSKSSKKESSSSGSGSHAGDATYYGVGLGSCGKTNKDSDMIVALNHGQMGNGANPNHNGLCGKTITAHGPKGSVTVTIVDTCPGCANGDLDLSPAAFNKIADMEKGRVPITWDFN